MALRLLLCLGLCFASITAEGHTRSESYSTWRVSDNAIFARISVPGLEVTRLPESRDGTRSLAAILAEEVRNTARVVDADGNDCVLESLQPIAAAAGILRLELSFVCAADPSRILYAALFEAAPSHIHYARIFEGDQLLAETLLRGDRVGIELGADDKDASYRFADFFRLGIDHIISGIDHIAFLAGLLLVAGAMKRSLVAVTGFTIGHSVSLAAAVLGFVSADARLVEAFIGFTVGLIALEYFLLRDSRTRELSRVTGSFAAIIGVLAFGMGAISGHALFAYLGLALFAWCYLRAAALLDEGLSATGRSGIVLLIATFCFGLVHGFGFAGYLVDTGLLGAELFTPLLGFNLGVEAGQLLLIAVSVALVYPVRRALPPVIPQVVAACLCGLGVFWFVSRSFA
jgi:hypothetical protein